MANWPTLPGAIAGAGRPDRGVRWLAWLVATATEDRLSFLRRHASFAADLVTIKGFITLPAGQGHPSWISGPILTKLMPVDE